MDENVQVFVVAQTDSIEAVKDLASRVDQGIVVLPTILGSGYIVLKVSASQFKRLWAKVMDELYLNVIDYHGETEFTATLEAEEVSSIVSPLYKVYLRDMHDVYFDR